MKLLLLVLVYASIVEAFQSSTFAVRKIGVKLDKSRLYAHTITADPIVNLNNRNFRNATQELAPFHFHRPEKLHPFVFPLEKVELMERSAVVVASALMTWGFIHNVGLTAVQASGLQGVLASLTLPTPFAAAALCGSFAAMYAKHATGLDVLLLGALTGAVFYTFESGDKVQKGKGGRLGLAAFLANLIFIATRHAFRLSAMPLGFSAKLGQAASLLIPCFMCKDTDTCEAVAWKARFVQTLPRLAILGVLVYRYLHGAAINYLQVLRTAITIFTSSYIVKHSPGVVFPVAMVALVSGFMVPSLAPAAYLGATLGMTSLPSFSVSRFLEASTLAALAFNLVPLDGIAGRLGFFSVLSVNFSM